MSKAKNHCVTVVRMNPRVRKLYEEGKAPKVIWDTLGERCFVSKAAADRYIAKVTAHRPGRSRMETDYRRRA